MSKFRSGWIINLSKQTTLVLNIECLNLDQVRSANKDQQTTLEPKNS